MPAGVSLQSLKIVDGVIAFHGPKGIGFAELDGLNGELKAESIDGPFAFKGITKYKGADRDVRISTGPREADGGIRFKAMVRGTAGATSIYTVDGRLDDLKGRPRVSGELTAKLALAEGDVPGAAAPVAVPPPVIPAFAPTPTPGAGTAGTNTPGTSTPGTSAPVAAPVAGDKAAVPLIDFKARIAGDAKGLRLDDIAVSFQHVGQPQLISGSATATWTEALNVEMGLSSRWLDLDRVAKLQDGAGSPFETARNFILAMMEALPKNADSKVNFDLDQASLGGEAVSGIKLEVARAQGALLLNNLRAASARRRQTGARRRRRRCRQRPGFPRRRHAARHQPRPLPRLGGEGQGAGRDGAQRRAVLAAGAPCHERQRHRPDRSRRRDRRAGRSPARCITA